MDLNPFGGNFNVNVNEEDSKNALTYATLGLSTGGILSEMGFRIEDPLGTKAAAAQQQTLINQYHAQQDALMRDEQNRRWQNEISNSWAAYGAQRRSQVVSGAGTGLGSASGAVDLYLGGR